VITLSLLVLVSGALLASFESIQRSESFARGRAEALDEMRLTMSRMTKEIRQGSIVTAPTTGERLEIDTYVGGTSKRVTYLVAADALMRQVEGQDSVVLQEGLVDTQVFAYSPSADLPELVTITLRVRPPNLPDTTVEYESEVVLRNLAGEE
jgi:hypothetical protein